jgi:hypothetical protein
LPLWVLRQGGDHGCSFACPGGRAAGGVRGRFGGELARLGYKPKAAVDQLRLMVHLSRWMDAARLDVAGPVPPMTEAFLAARAPKPMC